MDLMTLVNQMRVNGNFDRVLNNPLAFLGTEQRPYMGATLLPEKTVKENHYTERAIRWRTLVANDGTRYSPVQKKRSMLTGTLQVDLGNHDVGSEFTAEDFDAMRELIKDSNPGDETTMQAMYTLTQWTDHTLLRPILEKNEVQRWQAIVDGLVLRRGDHGYKEDVAFSNPAGHRVIITGDWTDPTYDPFVDFRAMVNFFASKGMKVARMITSTPVLFTLLSNAKIVSRLSSITVVGGTVSTQTGIINEDQLNAILKQNKLPPLEVNDEQYQTDASTGFFLKRDVLVAVAATGRDQVLLGPDRNPLTLTNTLGYYGIGTPAGRSTPGRSFVIEQSDRKPPHIDGETWQTGFPVIQDPEGLYVMKSITTDT